MSEQALTPTKDVVTKEKKPLVEVKNLSVHFPVTGGMPFAKKKSVKAVSDMTLSIYPGETYGLVGESGCGKSTLANAMLGMVSPTNGTVYFKGKDLFGVKKAEFNELRRSMQMVFQDPYSSLNPRWDVSQIIGEPMRIRGGYTEEEVEARVVELLKLVGLSERDLHRHPSDFSGGQRQRIGIARALAGDPGFIVADEPVSALDVSVQAAVVNLLMDIQRECGTAFLFIAHDIAVVEHISKRIMVMYLGHVMESAPAHELVSSPRHPYTQALLSAVPTVGSDGKKRMILAGDVPSPLAPPEGCPFHPRCPYAKAECRCSLPPWQEENGHGVRCFYPLEK